MYYWINEIKMNNKQRSPKHSLNIAEVFWQQKKIILITTLITTLLTGVWIFTHTPTYEANVLIGAPLGVEASLVHVDPFFYLKSPQTHEFSASELYNAFAYHLRSPSIKQLFFTSGYLSSLSTQQKQTLSTKKLYANYTKNVKVIADYSNKQTRYLISVRADTPQQAKQQLRQFIEFVNQKASNYLNIIFERRKQLMMNTLQQQIQIFDEANAVENTQKNTKIEQIKNNSIEPARVFAAQVAKKMMESYEKRYQVYNKQILSIPQNTLFRFESQLNISNTIIESKIKRTLLLGGFGGLILGFLLASMYCGFNEEKREHQ